MAGAPYIGAIFIIRLVTAATLDFSLTQAVINREWGRPAIGPILHCVPLTAAILSGHGYAMRDRSFVLKRSIR